MQTDENQAMDNIEAQLDMAVEAADDIGDFSILEEEHGESNSIEADAELDNTHNEVPEDVSTTGQVTGGEQQTQAEGQDAIAADGVATGQDQRGNLINAGGEVVAKAGAERRVYERNQRTQQENLGLQRQLSEMQTQFQAAQEFGSEPQKYNLTNADAITGMRLMQSLKDSPVEAARQILQTAVAQGYNLQDIIGNAHGQSSSMDMGAINQMISEKLAPITQREEQYQQQQAIQQQNEQTKQRFLSTHEHSNIHLDAITNLLQNNQNMSPEQAYFEVKSYALRKGYDFTQPLPPQIQAGQANGQPPTQPLNQPNRAMPNGNAASTVVTQSQQQANGDDDWDAIVRSSMAESGMQF